MTSNRIDFVPARGHALFACGTVLGVCLGFAAGHLSVWSRAQSNKNAASPGWAWTSDDTYRLPSLGDPGSAATETLGLVPPTPDKTEPFFSKAARRLTSPPPIDINTPRSAIRVATETSSSVTTPDTLPEGVRAAPIDDETRLQEQVTRSIIAQEMPHASAQEQDVWFDVLRGLDAADVKGILRMRKHVGSGNGGMAAAPGHLNDPLGSFGEISLPDKQLPVASAWEETLPCLQQVRDIRLHNLCNAATIGFQRLEPVLCEAGGSGHERGVRLIRVDREVARGELQETGRCLDVAIDGPGFLQVRNNHQTRLTRSGRLRIDEERHLALATTLETWRLDPPIVIPADTCSLTIAPDGRVTARAADTSSEKELGTILTMAVLDPAGLRYEGEGLWTTTAASGERFRIERGSTLRQFGVERPSRAALQEDIDALDQLEALVERLMRTTEPRGESPHGD